MTGRSRWGNSKKEGVSLSKPGETVRMTQRIIRLEPGTLESTRHEKMHIEDAENVIGKTHNRKELPEGINKDLKPVDRRLWRTNKKGGKNDTIDTVMRTLIELRPWEWSVRRGKLQLCLERSWDVTLYILMGANLSRRHNQGRKSDALYCKVA